MKEGAPLSITSDNGSTTTGEFISRKGGWISYYDPNGTIRKVRANQVKEVRDTTTQPGVTEMSNQESTTVSTTGILDPNVIVGANEATGANEAVKDVSADKSTVDNLREARLHYHKEKIGAGKEARILVDCDDEIAKELRGSDLETVYSVASSKSGKTVEELKAKYGHLNNGMQRMNLGNVIRGALRPKPDKSMAEAAKAEAKAAKEKAKAEAKEAREKLIADKKAAAEAAKAEAKVKREADAAVKKAEREAKAAEAKAAKEKAKAEAKAEAEKPSE